jgi:hypothetical protein
VPSIDGVELLLEVLVLVGPRTLEVRSTLHPAAATNAASRGVTRVRDRFMGLVSSYRPTRLRPTRIDYRIVGGPTVSEEPLDEPSVSLNKHGRRPGDYTKLARRTS